MTDILPKLPSIERYLEALLVEHMDGLTPGLVGGDLAYDELEMPFYVRLEKLPGRATQLEATFVVDIEVFAPSYLEAESRSLDIDAVVLGYPHVVRVDDRTVVFDSVTQNTGPAALPWSDDSVTRMGATYAIHIRRH